jgi:NitT/TauT family transport system substrate-binding protein
MMFRMKTGGIGAVSAALLLVLAGCAGVSTSSGSGTDSSSGDSASTSVLPTVRFQAFSADPAGIPLVVIQELGLDEKYGFKAEIVEVDPDAAATNILIGGADVAVEQDAVNATLGQQQGYDMVVFYPTLNTMMSMVVLEDSPYQTPEDLIGKRVGHFGVDSGTTSVIALMLKELYDIDFFTDYDLREVGPAALPELLISGEVDAIINYEPLALRAVIQGPGRYIFEPAKAWAAENEGWSPYLTNLAASKSWLEGNPEVALGVLEAWKEAVKVISDSNYEIFAEEPYKTWISAGDDEELAAFIEYCADLPCYQEGFTQGDVDQLTSWLQLMVDNGVLLDAMPTEPVAVVLKDLLK